VSERKNPK